MNYCFNEINFIHYKLNKKSCLTVNAILYSNEIPFYGIKLTHWVTVLSPDKKHCLALDSHEFGGAHQTWLNWPPQRSEKHNALTTWPPMLPYYGSLIKL